MRYKIDLTTKQSSEIYEIFRRYDITRYYYQSINYTSIELTKSYISKRINLTDEEMTRVLVDCFILTDDSGELRYVYREIDVPKRLPESNSGSLYEELLRFMTPYIREYKIDNIL
jgi:hypothetical protein